MHSTDKKNLSGDFEGSSIEFKRIIGSCNRAMKKNQLDNQVDQIQIKRFVQNSMFAYINSK